MPSDLPFISPSLPLTDAELAAWLAVSTAPGVSPATLRKLLTAFGLPLQILAQPPAVLARVAGTATAEALGRMRGAALAEAVARTRAWCEAPAHHLLTLGDPAYPQRLLQLADPPPLLFVSGRLALLQRDALAIVGSRHGSPQGLANAEQFARTLGSAGLTIVSGMALGIDAAAHRGALETAASTIAVIGTGADGVYPPQHRALAGAIAERGAVVSEWPLGTPPRRAHFPQRNRVIAALCRGVLVVEAAARSGSLITARLANDIGREVFAIPGSIHAPLAKGCHQLLKQGAKLVESAEDILEELRPALPVQSDLPMLAAAPHGNPASGTAPRGHACTASGPAGDPAVQAAAPSCDAEQQRTDRLVLRALGHDPAAFEQLAARTALGSAALQAALLRLELDGQIQRQPGARVARLRKNET